jgi:hypothetical protein
MKLFVKCVASGHSWGHTLGPVCVTMEMSIGKNITDLDLVHSGGLSIKFWDKSERFRKFTLYGPFAIWSHPTSLFGASPDSSLKSKNRSTKFTFHGHGSVKIYPIFMHNGFLEW